MNRLKIRAANSTDLDRLWEMWKEIMDQKVFFPHDDTWSRSDVEKSWINLDNQCYVAEREQKIVGAYILKPNQPGYGKHIANASYLVDTKYRGGGIGHQLCEHSIDAARSHGYRGMQFNLVVSTNKGAINIWLEHGFKIIGTIPGGFYHAEKGYVDAHIFFRNLD